jgi:hypothetical protein
MIRLTALLFLASAATLAVGQETKKSSNLPSACEIRAYYLDKDGKPADPSDVKAALIFETKDGKTKSYPMTLTAPDKDKPTDVPRCRHLDIDGTSYKMAVGAFCTDASTPGGNTHYGKPFLKPLPAVIEPDPKQEPDKRDTALSAAPYFKTVLNEQTIADLASVPYTDASVQFTIRGEGRKTRCFTCVNGTPGAPRDRVMEELDTLEKQVQAKDWDGAKGTMIRIHDTMNAFPAGKANESARKDAATCCKDLDAAVQAQNRDKALAEIKRLREKCDKCGDSIDSQDKDSKREPKK